MPQIQNFAGAGLAGGIFPASSRLCSAVTSDMFADGHFRDRFHTSLLYCPVCRIFCAVSCLLSCYLLFALCFLLSATYSLAVHVLCKQLHSFYPATKLRAPSRVGQITSPSYTDLCEELMIPMLNLSSGRSHYGHHLLQQRHHAQFPGVCSRLVRAAVWCPACSPS
jgi:sugar phosphate permease